MKKTITTIAASLIALSSFNSQALADNPDRQDLENITVNQGDSFHILKPEGRDESSHMDVFTVIDCTIGYVDEKLHRAYTAGHCGETGFTAKNDQGEEIGSFHKNPRYNPKTYRNDQAYIELNDNIIVGDNYFSGDNVVDVEDLSTGDTLCSYGAKSKKTHCGELRTVDEKNIVGDSNSGGIPGDSGGPSWVPGKGLVGLFSARYYHGDKDDNNKHYYACIFNSIHGESLLKNKKIDVKPVKKYDNGTKSYDLQQMLKTAHNEIMNRDYKNVVDNMKENTEELVNKSRQYFLKNKNTGFFR